ncbi:hypothetical protein B0J14DRAFT_643388 [Halenospora varia]|nr:hypothetical protein B0J14DRAFT_643388 [Halenospora varia]
MQDPSQGIARELIPHVHLLSTYRFPQLLQLHPDKVAEWLQNAPRIARAEAPFYWTYLDRPADGNILLVWQSPVQGTEFPSDGYVWAPGETVFQLDIGGYLLEMYHQKTGYAPGEPVATHSRRRYRLVPSRNPNAAGHAPPDSSLWIVHYGQAEVNDRIPSNMIPVDMRVQSTMQTRTYLQSQGQIVQKEFMLNDRPNWPQIAFPRNQPRGAPMYGGNVPPARIPPSMAYPTQQHAVPGPPAKRVRTQPNPNQAAANNAVAVLDVDDEEDTSRGDLFDHTTPREISTARYKQNHEWMEEILSSPYAINQIVPADLGLGIRGSLAALTEGIFDAPLDPDKDVAKHTYVGRLEEGKADEFRKRVTERVMQTDKEMEKMRAKHARRLTKFQKGSLINRAEKELRHAANDPLDVGPEYWRLEGKIDEEDSDEPKPVTRTPAKVADILAQVEASLGRHTAAVRELIRIQDGGYEQPVAVPSPQAASGPSPRVSPPNSNNGSQNSGVMVGDADMDMGGSAAGLLDQFHTGLSSNATPGSNFASTPQPHLQANSSAGTPNNMPAASPQPLAPEASAATQSLHDVNMGEGQTSGGEQPPTDATGTGDWVVVPPGGVSPSASGQAQPTTTQPSAPAPATSTPSATMNAELSPLPTASSNQTPLPDFHTSPNDFADLGDLEGADGALGSYGDDLGDTPGGGLGDLGMDMDVAMDDSAFGEAFHGVESRGEGEGDENGL